LRLKSEDKGERFASTVPNFLSMAQITNTTFYSSAVSGVGQEKAGSVCFSRLKIGLMNG
jgi:hypothetical protein